MIDWIRKIITKMFPPLKPVSEELCLGGKDVLVAALTDQCCAWFGIPRQEPPKLCIFNGDRTPVAVYDAKSDMISVFGAENATERVLAHEVAHAVVIKYGHLSERMHEILAGYAEYKITKVFRG